MIGAATLTGDGTGTALPPADPIGTAIDERAAFESWARPRWSTAPTEVFDIVPGRPDVEYNGDSVQAAWAGWQARAQRDGIDTAADPAPTVADFRHQVTALCEAIEDEYRDDAAAPHDHARGYARGARITAKGIRRAMHDGSLPAAPAYVPAAERAAADPTTEPVYRSARDDLATYLRDQIATHDAIVARGGVSPHDGERLRVLLADLYGTTAAADPIGATIAAGTGVLDVHDLGADPDPATLVPGDGDDALAAVVDIAALLGCACTLDAIEGAISDLQAAAPFDLVAHLQRQREWSERTFGPGLRTAGVCDHISKELDEIAADPSDAQEWIDVVILALDGAWRAGWTPPQIIAGLVAKQAKNEQRTWPDWRTCDPRKAIEHDRGPADAWPKTGDIVRYGSGSGALARLRQPHAGGWHGDQCMGGTTFLSNPTPASAKDLQTWADRAHWRGEKPFPPAPAAADQVPA